MSREDLQKKAYTKTFKLALATSIIRSKPANLSSREYAQQLATNIRNSEQSWKTKFENVESELVDTKQHMVLLQLKNQSLLQSMKIPSEQCNGITCEKKDDDATTEDEPAYGDDKMLLNHKFLSSVTSFKHWNSLLQSDNDSIQMIKKSIIGSLKDFDSCLERLDLNRHNLSLIMENMKTFVELVKKEAFTLDGSIDECCSNIVRSLIKLVITSAVETSLCEQLALILVLIARSCSAVRDTVMNDLVNVIAAYSELLADCSSFTSLDVNKYENMFFICHALKETFLTTSKVWPSIEYGRYCCKLDVGVVTIANMFPMYAHTVWLTSSLMADAQCQAEQSNPFARPTT